jgi:hypothetical protein
LTFASTALLTLTYWLNPIFSGDIICTSTGSIYAHLAYSGSPQQTQAIAFAVSQLRAAGI